MYRYLFQMNVYSISGDVDEATIAKRLAKVNNLIFLITKYIKDNIYVASFKPMSAYIYCIYALTQTL